MQVDLFDQNLNAILDAGTYEDFASRLRAYDCRRCTLCKGRSRIVVDRGNPAASIFIISERPGENEDREGRAFVGRSGELLDKILASIGLDANQDTLIANVVKCKPEEDRAPTSDEATACLPFLEKQIELVKPRVVLLLGQVALKWMDPTRKDFKMEEEAGRLFTLPRFPGVQFMVLYHPAFLLRDPRKKRPMWEHVKLLKAYFEEHVDS
ncbi:MAG: uracil-DNA glycosylase [Candidatus Krumholzibacteriia bacterium]